MAGQEDSLLHGQRFQSLLTRMDLLEAQHDRVDEALEQLMASLSQYITTLPAIGPISGAAILAEIGDVSRLPTVEKLVA